MYSVFFFFSFYGYADHRDLHSFPTRRSSDLRESKNASAQSVVWLNGGGGDGLVTEKKNLSAPLRSPLPRKESKTDPLKERQPDEARPYLASAPSDIQLPTPRPSPKPTPTATPARSPKPSPTAKAKTTPKPTPKPTSTAS